MNDSYIRLEIKKYPNRRYYDATNSCHTTLEEIRNHIKAGAEVKITDSRSEADITSKVLAQIILEFESPKLDHFPAPILTLMIRGRDSVVEDFIQNYMCRAYELFQQTHSQWEAATSSSMPPSPMTAWAETMMNFIPRMPQSSTEQSQEDATGMDERIRGLEDQLEALRNQIGKS